MKALFHQSQIYMFLHLCETNDVERKILDCGAGGYKPPLAIFKDHDYETFGIEINNDAIKKANKFEQKYKYNLNIKQGDIRQLPFEDNTFGAVYSYNTLFHMMKSDIYQSIKEMSRVLKPGGLLYFNLLSTNDSTVSNGRDLGKHEMEQTEHGSLVIHSYFGSNEAEVVFEEHHISVGCKNTITTEIPNENNTSRFETIEYVLSKE